MNTEAQPIAPQERIYGLDVIRGFALLSLWWLTRFEMRTVEWSSRRLTYGNVSMRHTRTAAPAA
jgi:uncharacterized membrane protein YeiB